MTRLDRGFLDGALEEELRGLFTEWTSDEEVTRFVCAARHGEWHFMICYDDRGFPHTVRVYWAQDKSLIDVYRRSIADLHNGLEAVDVRRGAEQWKRRAHRTLELDAMGLQVERELTLQDLAEQRAAIGQSRKMSAVETVASTAIGFVVAMLAQKIILPMFGLHASNSDHFWIAVLFTFVSIVRGYCVRRLFNWIGRRGK